MNIFFKKRSTFDVIMLIIVFIHKESISKFLIANRFHVTLYACEIDFLLKNLLIGALFMSLVRSTYLNTDMCRFESTQKNQSRAHLADSCQQT